MRDNYVYNWDFQNLKAESITKELVEISEAMYQISNEINKISVDLAMKVDQSKIKAIENLSEQIDFLTKELDEIKRA
ncbi:hypothetical protein FH508_0013300 [Lysinibacillus sp. CD3-6]|uniref:hypothetical protein n=1 Tax=Lysinibacillus sp. CD3-6 TaxID=2892541 RepID=UPI001170DF49|nr:hypothetical protein [Lysinibacillus sp. CD3-6]UED78439.1 hypothetical protein FH508_0013300 [Lysinibacillus sp. CD3-6]